MWPVPPPSAGRGGAGVGPGCAPAAAAEGRAHSPFSPEEIEKKLNGYHKGAKIWKMLIFCQVGLRASGAGSGGSRVPPPARAGGHLCAACPASHGL